MSDRVILRYRDGMFLPEPGVTSLSKLAQAVTAQGVFLTLLKRFEASNRTVGDKSSRSYAPSLFAREDEAKKAGLNSKLLEAAMRQLFKDGKIWNEPCGRPSRPSFRIAIKG